MGQPSCPNRALVRAGGRGCHPSHADDVNMIMDQMPYEDQWSSLKPLRPSAPARRGCRRGHAPNRGCPGNDPRIRARYRIRLPSLETDTCRLCRRRRAGFVTSVDPSSMNGDSAGTLPQERLWVHDCCLVLGLTVAGRRRNPGQAARVAAADGTPASSALLASQFGECPRGRHNFDESHLADPIVFSPTEPACEIRAQLP